MNFFKNNIKKNEHSSSAKQLLNFLQKKRISSDEEIAILQNAREKYDKGGDINECINTYSEILSKGTSWNSFNFWLTLINLYKKANMNDLAWQTIQQARNYSMTHNFPIETQLAHEEKLSKEEYKISKAENRNYDALSQLLEYHVLKSSMYLGNEFNYQAFWKEGQSLFKKLKLTNEMIDNLTNRIMTLDKTVNISSDAHKTVKEWMRDYKLGIFADQ